MNETEEIQWLGTMVDDEALTKDEIINGFPLLQLLSLISPTSVDLGFLTAQWNSPDIDTKIEECLKKGITYLQLNIPPTFKLGLKNRQTEFGEKMGEISKLFDITIDKSDLSMFILKYLREIWISCQRIDEASNDTKPKLTSQDTLVEIDKMELDSCDIEVYVPTEPTLRPMIRLIIHNAIKYLETKNSRTTLQTLKTILSKISSKDSNKIPNEVIEYICTGELYNLTTEFILKLKPTKPNEFLDMLIENGSLNIQSHMLDSIKEMIHETSPFYESIHINIISAFISSQTKKLKVDKIVSYLGSCFVDYDKDLDYPFDIEDAFLIWMQQCFKVLKPGLEIDYEFEDLTKDLDGGWLLVLVISQYFSIEFDHQKLSCKTYVNNVEKSLNHQILNEVVEKCNNGLFVCWEAVDMVSERQRDGKYISPGNVSYLFVNLLFDLFQIVSIENIPFIKDVKKTKKLRDSKIKSDMIISKEETKNEMLLSIPNLLKLSEMNPQDERKLSAHLDPVSEKETDKPFNQEILSPKMSKMKQFKANNKHAANESKLKTKDKIKGPTTLPKKQGIIEDILKMSDTEVESSTLSKKKSQPVQSVAEDIIISNEFSTTDSEILIENAIETIQKKDSMVIPSVI